jgi:hypothetical protein
MFSAANVFSTRVSNMPYGALNSLGVTPMTSCTIFMLQKRSEMSSSFESDVSDECDQVCNPISWPAWYICFKISGCLYTFEPIT